MEKAIYKIENKINHKIYIGQSKNPKERFIQHCERTPRYKSLIHDAIIKYGKENFSFEVLGWFEDYNEKEKYYIQYYQSLIPNGYNIAQGGEEPPIYSGDKNPSARITNEVAEQIKKDLKNWKIPRKQIVKKYNITQDIIRHINDGSSWNDKNESYPLRPQEKEINKIRVNKIIELLLTTNIPMNQIGAEVGWSRSSAKEINAGRNHYNEKLIYPLRNNKEKNKAILNL